MIDWSSIDWHLVGSAAGAFFTGAIGLLMKARGDKADKKIISNERRLGDHEGDIGDLRNTVQSMISYARLQEIVLKECEGERAMLRQVRSMVFDILKIPMVDQEGDEASPTLSENAELRRQLLDAVDKRQTPKP